ncbi:hypothetical protein UFOVP643_17 [uncultured Caudovirales phage]|uniref:Uncharacterized protein n=1 Tax=uncultured Caudovirales phage TaxID=2100421 RepID=A0A6J5LMS8_9CAUD|nr:hypothetical protein UFOVP282_18 [uncultured Caudovirales phage]CAB4154634.1 hypothetical protein UFOVP643_17 [uncultured Caudovirales phage]
MSVIAQTYRDVVQQMRTICSNHPAIETFRVGPASMIEIPTQDQPTSAKYPYVMLIPQPASLDGRSTQFDFDLVVMDLAKDVLDLEETIHSSTMEILRDILAAYTMTKWATINYNLSLPVVATPFVEGYNNSVAGWTAQISIEAKSPFDHCNNPIILA